MGNFAKEIQSAFKNEWAKTNLNIRYTANYLYNLSEKHFSQYGISSQQYNVLRILRGAKKPITVSKIKSRMVEKTSNTTRLMDKLCAKTLIKRSRSESDRRTTVYTEITQNGLGLLLEIDQLEFKTPLSSLTEEEIKELNRVLDKIRP